MAEAIGLAASIARIASVGDYVVSTLTKFGISYRGSNDKIHSLAGRVSMSVSILSDIKTTVEANASRFKKEEFWKTWRKVLSLCEESYGRLERGVSKAKRWEGRGRRETSDVSVWEKLVWAFGGEGEMRDLEKQLDRCCQQVMMMQQTIQMSVLSLVTNRQERSAEEVEDQRDMMGKLQWLLSTLSEAGVLQAGETKGTTTITDDDKSDTQENISRGGDSPATTDSPPLTRGLGNGIRSPHLARGYDNGTGAPVTETNLPKPCVMPCEVKKPPTSTRKEFMDYFFEAYYIIPRSLPRNQQRGQIQLCKPAPDDHMIICLDIKKDYRQDANLRQALRRAKRGAVVKMDAERFPRSVRDATLSLANLRERHVEGLTCVLAESIKLQCVEDSNGLFRRSSAKTAFLIIFRGSVLKLEDRAIRKARKDRLVDQMREAEIKFLEKEQSRGGKAEFQKKMKKHETAKPILNLRKDKRASNDTRPVNRPPEGVTNILRARSLPPEPKLDSVPALAPTGLGIISKPLSADHTTGEKKKRKGRVSFDATAERPTSRPLPGPIQYESARSRLIGNNVQSTPSPTAPPTLPSYSYAPVPDNWAGISQVDV